MSEGDLSGSIHSQLVFPLLLLAVGAILLSIGYSQFLEFNLDQAEYLRLQPDNRITLLLIIGSASATAGILGTIRGYLYR